MRVIATAGDGNGMGMVTLARVEFDRVSVAGVRRRRERVGMLDAHRRRDRMRVRTGTRIDGERMRVNAIVVDRECRMVVVRAKLVDNKRVGMTGVGVDGEGMRVDRCAHERERVRVASSCGTHARNAMVVQWIRTTTRGDRHR